jgi:hypothetical protein
MYVNKDAYRRYAVLRKTQARDLRKFTPDTRIDPYKDSVCHLSGRNVIFIGHCALSEI